MMRPDPETEFLTFSLPDAIASSLSELESGFIAAVDRLVSSDFGDPEGLFYLTRHLAHLGEIDRALDLFRRVVGGGYFCYPAMARDPWLDPLRRKPEFTKLLSQAETRHREAATTFAQLKGDRLLGAASTQA